MKRGARASDPAGGGDATISARAADAGRGRTAKKSAGKDANRGRAAKERAETAKTVAPGPRDGRKFARVFMSGRSQAVRLPKEFRFDVDRVIIRREGRHIVLSPPFKDWEDYFENSTPLPDDVEEILAKMRREELPLEEREPFD